MPKPSKSRKSPTVAIFPLTLATVLFVSLLRESPKVSALSESQSPSAVCNVTSPPNLGSVARQILTGSGSETHFIGVGENDPTKLLADYTTLSQAAWCSFIALNWAAAATKPPNQPTMAPDASKPLGTCTTDTVDGNSNCNTVWETFLDSSQVYPASSPGGLAAIRKRAAPTTHFLRAGNPNMLTGKRLATADIKALQSEFGSGGVFQATGFVLPDKNNFCASSPCNASPSFILYEVRENPCAAAFITNPANAHPSLPPGNSCTVTTLQSGTALASLNGQQKIYQDTPPPSAGLPPGQTPVDFPPQAFEVKPSWYVMTPAEQKSNNFGMMTAVGQCDTGGTCPPGSFQIGLTGFHILWKVFPKSSWFWMTFEYDGTNGAPVHGTVPNAFFTPVLYQSVNYNQGGMTWLPMPLGPDQPGWNNTNPKQPAPADPVLSAATAANTYFQGLLRGKAVLGNYRLVGLQVAPVIGSSPTLLANSHIETDFGATNVNNNPSSSCITCHSLASIGSVNTSGCPSKPASMNRIGIRAGTTPPSGYSGAFPVKLYQSSQTAGPSLSSDFVWSVNEAQWQGGNGCTGQSAKP